MRKPKVHNVKMDVDYFQISKQGLKDWELRFNDRDYQEQDIIVLMEYIEETGEITGEVLLYRIVWIYEDPSILADNYVILSLKPLA